MRSAILSVLVLFSVSVSANTHAPQGATGDAPPSPTGSTAPDPVDVKRRAWLGEAVGGKADDFDPKDRKAFEAKAGDLRYAVDELSAELQRAGIAGDADPARAAELADQLARGRSLLETVTKNQRDFDASRAARFDRARTTAASQVEGLLGTLLTGAETSRALDGRSAAARGLPDRLVVLSGDGKGEGTLTYIGHTANSDAGLYSSATGRVFGVPTKGDLGSREARATALAVSVADAKAGRVPSVDLSAVMTGPVKGVFPTYWQDRNNTEVSRPAADALATTGKAVSGLVTAGGGRIDDFISGWAAKSGVEIPAGRRDGATVNPFRNGGSFVDATAPVAKMDPEPRAPVVTESRVAATSGASYSVGGTGNLVRPRPAPQPGTIPSFAEESPTMPTYVSTGDGNAARRDPPAAGTIRFPVFDPPPLRTYTVPVLDLTSKNNTSGTMPARLWRD